MRRHARAGGNPKQISKSIDKTKFHKHQAVASRLCGHDGKVFFQLIDDTPKAGLDVPPRALEHHRSSE
ncbi:hypothetical protein [Conchiformibius kuhniae]|uniref:Transposase n=1 Tax=Conchiformibius kuhniae TaxID=211502 RepID=A0ABD8B842_9NEIS|nr:hypothetical protein [Conchiformibius kuhniae]